MNKMVKVALTGLLGLGLCGGTLAFAQPWQYSDHDSRWGWQNGRWGWQDDHDQDDHDRDRDRDHDRDRDRDRNHGPFNGNGAYNNGRYGNGRYGQNQAYNFGFQDGMNYGRRDREAGRRATPTSSGMYSSATRGYNSSMGDKTNYRLQYRSGYRDGYMRGYGR